MVFWKNLSENSLGLDELFPVMRILNLTYPLGGHIFDRIYPNLEELNAFNTPLPDLIKFIEKHPHIKRLRLRKSSVELLQVVNDKLPELEVFDFHLPKDLHLYQGDQIKLERYEKVGIRDYDHRNILGKIAFNQLKHLELTIVGKVNENWIEFIGENTALETLIIAQGDLINSMVLKLSTKLNSLIKADIWCYSDIEVDTIVQFLMCNAQMTKTHLTFTKSSILFIDALTKRLENDWTVTTADKSFRRIGISKKLPRVLEPISNDQNSTETITANATENNNQGITISGNITDNGNSHLHSNTALISILLTIAMNSIKFQ